MRVVVTVYPDGEDIKQPIAWARALGFEVEETFSLDHGRCVTIKGDISTAELKSAISLLSPDSAVAAGP